MKINKLFHWLYAILMLLPVFFIGSRCFYVILNKNAKDSYYGETINERQQVNITNSNDLKLSEDYIFTLKNGLFDNSLPSNVSIDYDFIEILNISSISTTYIENSNRLIITSVQVDNQYRYNYTFYWEGGSSTQQSTWDIALTFRFNLTGYGNNVSSMVANDMLSKYEYNKFSYLDNVFLYSVNSINEVQLFSWAQTSFLSAPMVYITGLFGMPSNSPVITLLSYWLSISIVWLVFDLVMYIPLLVHRWIDRGILE